MASPAQPCFHRCVLLCCSPCFFTIGKISRQTLVSKAFKSNWQSKESSFTWYVCNTKVCDILLSINELPSDILSFAFSPALVLVHLQHCIAPTAHCEVRLQGVLCCTQAVLLPNTEIYAFDCSCNCLIRCTSIFTFGLQLCTVWQAS